LYKSYNRSFYSAKYDLTTTYFEEYDEQTQAYYVKVSGLILFFFLALFF
ncbi:MAG: hypothetical protein HUU50_23260, partial [Candidatus Brocadiae bacterium]|nr:hypothetical protein [Candidatus Brocadiia bacterium]